MSAQSTLQKKPAGWGKELNQLRRQNQQAIGTGSYLSLLIQTILHNLLASHKTPTSSIAMLTPPSAINL